VSFLRKKESHTTTNHPGMPNFLLDENSEAKDSGKCVSSLECETTSSYEMGGGRSHFSVKQPFPNSVPEAQCSIASSSDHSDAYKEDKNMMLRETQKDQNLHHCCRTVVKKARHSTYSQLTLKSFFKHPKSPHFTHTESTETPHTQADSGKGNENMFHETESVCDRNLVENIEEDSCELIVPERNTCAQDPENINLCFSSKMEKGSAAVLEWQKIQEKMRTSIPLCKGHREPCVARSVKKGPNVGRRFYVCARPKVLDFLQFFDDFLIHF